MSPTPTALSMDIGGSHVTAALVDLRDRAVIQPSLVKRSIDPDAPAAELLSAWACAALQAAAQSPGGAVAHVGIGMPGPFEYAAGISRLTHKFAALFGLNVAAALHDRWAGSPLTAAPIHFANDAAVWALGEAWGGSGRGFERVIGLTLGTGLGSGFNAFGKIVSSGPEVPPGGEVWNLPFHGGIYEDFVCGRAIVGAYATRVGGPALSAAEIARLALSGDPDALEVYRAMGARLAELMAPWVGSFHPGCLVVGGSIAHSWDLFQTALQAGLPGLSCRVTTLFEASSLLGGAVLGL